MVAPRKSKQPRHFSPSGCDPKCERCDLRHEMRHHVCIWGNGPDTCALMLVGIMPGIDEDREGAPWVGAAGQYLRARLEEQGLSLDDLYATNVLKCMTPKDWVAGGFRKASPKELTACGPYLIHEIRSTQPKAILTMGDTPTAFFTGQSGITRARGGEVAVPQTDMTIIPTYNPAAMVRNSVYALVSGQEKRFEADITKAAAIAAGTWESTPMDVTVADTPAKIKKMFAGMETAEEIVVDVETTGLEDYRDWAQVYCLAVCFEDGHAWVLPWDHPDHPTANKATRKRFIELLHGKTIIGHNVKFDIRWLARLYGLDIWKVNFWDTRIVAHLLNENYPPKAPLKVLVRDHVNAPNYAFGMKWSKKQRSFMIGRRKIKWEDLLLYNGYDAGYNWLLKKKLQADLAEEPGLEALANTILFPSLRAFCQTELNGIGISEQRLLESRTALRERVQELQSKLRKEGLDVANMSKKVVVIDWIYHQRGHPVEKKTARRREPSIARAQLLRFVKADPAVGDLIECQEVLKLLGTYLGDPDNPDPKKRESGWTGLIHNSRLYSRYDLAGTVTGRTSCEGPNIQQVARDTRVRSVISAPEGWSLMNVDYSQIEIRIAAVIAKDRKLIADYAADLDVHRSAAAHVAGVAYEDVTDEQRTRAKARNFGFQYGMKWMKFKEYAFSDFGIEMTDEEAQAEEKFYHETYAGITRWQHRTAIGLCQEALEAQAEKRGETYKRIDTRDIRVTSWPPTVTSVLGRIRRLPAAYDNDRRVVEGAQRMGMNSPVQSPGSDFTQWAQARMYDSDVIRALGYEPPSEHGILKLDEIKVVMFCHDSVMFEVRDDCIDKYAPIVKDVMESIPLDEMGVGYWPVPLKADVDIYKHWGEKLEEEGVLVEEGGASE